MSFWKVLFGGGDVVKSVGDTLDDLITSDEERLSLRNEIAKAEYDFKSKIAELDTSVMLGQASVNEAEARSGNIFVAGWRPAIGWIGALCLFYNFVVFPLIKTIEPDIPQPINAEILWTMIMGMLGIGTMRSFDKFKHTDTKSVKIPKQEA